MSLLAFGVDHRISPLARRENLAYALEELSSTLPRLRSAAVLDECFIISTCNRTEVYAVTPQLSRAFDLIQTFLIQDRSLEPAEAEAPNFRLHDDAAVEHLFRIAAGLESMIVGEGQVLGQVRSAIGAARATGTLGPELDALGRHAIECGRRARTESRIARSTVSFGQAALQVASKQGGLAGKHVLVIGSGEIAANTVGWFRRAKPRRLTVVSRQLEHAAALARKHSGEAAPSERLQELATEADVVVYAASASEPLLTASAFMPGRQVLLIDLGVPRGISPEVGGVPGVVLYDLDQLQHVVAAGREARRGEIQVVESIVAEEVRRYVLWQRARQVTPTIVALRERAQAVRHAELERFRHELDELSPDQRAAVERMTSAIVNKLLHLPTTRLKELARERNGSAYVDAIRNLFSLDEPLGERAVEHTGG